MAIVKSNQNQGNDSNTNILGPQDNTAQNNSYVSNGNPYGSYASGGEITTSSAPVPQTNTANAPQSSRKSDTGASSGSFTNVQTYIDKNKAGAQNLSQAASGTLTNTSDIAKNNLNKASQSFQNQAQAGSLQNKENALNEANTAFNEAANQQAATQIENKSNQAYLYQPKQVGSGVNSDSSGLLSSVLVGKDGSTYNSSNIQNQNPTLNSSLNKADQDLINSNKSRVVFGDGTTRDFNTLAEANDAISSYNKANPGYYTYGNEQQLSSNDQRLSDILNAQYKGPTDLSEATGYNNAYSSVQDASAFQNQALNTGDQSELLRRTFSTGQNEYTTGNQLLDNLLLGQGEANQAFREVAQGLGTSESGLLADDLTAAQKQANQLAQQETADLRNIREQSRKGLSDTATQRQQEVESRIENVLQNWEQYPQYFRDRFQDAINNMKNLDSVKSEYNNAVNVSNSIKNKYSGTRGNGITVGELTARDLLVRNGFIDRNGNILKPYDSKMASNPTADKIYKELSTANDKVNQLKSTIDKGSTGVLDLNLSQLEAEALGIKGGEGLYNLLKDDIEGTSGIVRNEEEFKKLEKQRNDISNQYNSLSNIAKLHTDKGKSLKQQLDSLNNQISTMNIGTSKTSGTATIDNLLKTAQADKNQLVSRNEQSQLARLQSLAQLANDYGSANSGINFRNQYTNADLAGKQNATSALDMENFKNLVQGAERGFRNDAASSNITGQGWAEAKSGSGPGAKWAQAWGNNTQNFGDIIEKGGGYRNMYSDEGTNNELLKQVIDSTYGDTKLGGANSDDKLANTLAGYAYNPTEVLTDLFGHENNDLVNAAKWMSPITNPITTSILSGLGVSFGSKSAAQSQAQRIADDRALQDLKNKLNQKVTDTGLRNQFSVGQNAKNDLELLKLLGILDTTNL